MPATVWIQAAQKNSNCKDLHCHTAPLKVQEKPLSKQHRNVPLIPKSSYRVSHQAETSISRETSREHSKAVPQPKGGRSLPMPMWNWLCMEEPDPLCTLGVPGKDSANSCTDSKQSFYFKQNFCASGILSRFTSKSGEYRAPSYDFKHTLQQMSFSPGWEPTWDLAMGRVCPHTHWRNRQLTTSMFFRVVQVF